MTEQHQSADAQGDGWAAVPDVASISGTHEPGAPAQSPAGAVTPRPRRKLRRGALVGLVAGSAAVVLLLVGGVVAFSVGSATHAADRPVRAFLDDLTAGHVGAALDAAGIDHGADDLLLTDAGYAAATGRVTGYRIAATRTDGDTATVTAYLRQDGRDVSSTFTLDRTGSDWGVLPVWELEAPTLGSVAVAVRGPSGAALTVGDRKATTSKDGTLSLRALPGTYAVALDGGKWYSAEPASATVTGFGTASATPVQLTATLTAAGQQAAKRAVDAWVDGCIASTDAEPAGCSFYAYGEDPAYTYSNQKWTLESRPTVSVGAWLSSGWSVTTTTAGRATFTADISGPGGVGTASAGPMNVNASGTITGFTASGATFRSSIGNGSSDTGS